MAGPRTYRFGFLPSSWTLAFDGGVITPVADFEQRQAWVEQERHRDGFFYPRMERRVSYPPDRPQDAQPIPNTSRPQHLLRLPSSHTITVRSKRGGDLRYTDAGFIVNLLAYLFGTRLQFQAWWFDARVPVRAQLTHNVDFAKATAEDFLSRSYRTWKQWGRRDRQLFSSLLATHTRSPGYEWDWERFGSEYMVFDSLWRIIGPKRGLVVKGKREPPHKARIRLLCREPRVCRPLLRVRRFVRLRNQLIHEGLWDGAPPGTGSSMRAWRDAADLRRLNQRLIAAALGYASAYVRTSWLAIDTYAFDPPKAK